MSSKCTKSVRGLKRLVCAAAVVAMGACLAPRANAGVIWAVDTQNNLFSFDNLTPQNILTGHFISGALLLPAEQVLAIDFGNANSTPVLYGLTDHNRIVSLDPSTGAVTSAFALGTSQNGNHFGFDINPSTNFSTGRVVSDADQNTQVNFSTGGTVQSNLNYAAGDPNQGKNPSVVALGYRNVASGGAPTLYGIDTNLDTLVTMSPESSGTLHTVGPLGVDATGLTGMDISDNGVAFANIELPGSSVADLYAINLATGQASDQGRIIDGVQVRDIATEVGTSFIIPEPASFVMLGSIAMLGALRRRRA